MSRFNFTTFAAEAHRVAREKGWWDEQPEDEAVFANLHGELSEAWECYRDGAMDLYYVGDKPEGWPVELADVVIRIADYICGRGLLKYLDKIMDPSEEFDYHQDPKWVTEMHGLITAAYEHYTVNNPLLTTECLMWVVESCLQDPAVVEAILIKHEFNQTRSYRHGGKLA